jgi:hypothetical protein
MLVYRDPRLADRLQPLLAVLGQAALQVVSPEKAIDPF